MASQLGSNLGFGSMMSGLGENYSALSGLASQQSAESAMFGAKANLGFNVMNTAMKFSSGATEVFKNTKLKGRSSPSYPQGMQI